VCIVILQNAGLIPTLRSDWNARGNARSLQEELARIEELRKRDVAATLAQDQAALAELWTDDVVILQQGQEAEVGKQAALAKRLEAGTPRFRVVSYVPEYKDVTITDDGWAFEWGTFTAGYADAPGSPEKRFRGKMLRVLRRQSDGSWKGARGCVNSSE
jgi:uncharacterized protein (TIGR02246 family)